MSFVRAFGIYYKLFRYLVPKSLIHPFIHSFFIYLLYFVILILPSTILLKGIVSGYVVFNHVSYESLSLSIPVNLQTVRASRNLKSRNGRDLQASFAFSYVWPFSSET